MRNRITHSLLLLAVAAILAGGGGPRAATAAAEPIGLGPAAAAAGRLTWLAQTDRYRLDAVAGRTYVVEAFDVERRPDGEPDIAAYDAAGAQIGAGQAGWGEVAQTMTISPAASGPVELRVRGAGGWMGAYSLRALAAAGEPGAGWGEDGEPNNGCLIGEPLAAGRPLARRIAPYDPAYMFHLEGADAYRLQAEAGRAYLVEAGDAREGEVRGRITLFTPAGGPLGYVSAEGAEGAPARMLIPAGPARAVCLLVAGYLDGRWDGAYQVSAAALPGVRRVHLPLLLR